MYRRAFQALKRKFIHVSDLPTPYFVKIKTIFKAIGFLSNYGVGRPVTCKTCVSGPETHVYACLKSSPPYFDLKKNF